MRLKISNLSKRIFGGPAAAVFRGMGTLALGTGAARLIGFASIPVITRIYSPEDFGVLAIFTAFVALLVPILTLRYVVAVPLPRRDGIAMNLMALSAALMVAMTLIIAVGLWSLGPALLGMLSMEALIPYWWLIVLGILGTGSYELLSMWATRRKAYPIIAQTQVLQSAIGALVKIGLGLLALKPLGLLLGQIVAQSGGIGSFITRFRADFRRTAAMINLRRMLLLARYYRGFPLYRLPSQFLLVASTKTPMLFVASLFGMTSAGYFGLAWAVLILPSGLIAGALGKAYYGEIARDATNPHKILAITKRVALVVGLASFPFFLVLFFFADVLFALIFGSQWEEAGKYAAIMSIYILASMISVSLSPLVNIAGNQAHYLFLNALRVSFAIAVFSISGVAAWDILTTLRVYSFVMLSFHLFSIAFFFFILNDFARRALTKRSNL